MARKDKYLHELVGFNVRFNEIQGAIGRVMLKHLDAFNDNRRAIAARYTERLKGLAITPQEMPVGSRRLSHVRDPRGTPRDELQNVPERARHRNR